MDASYPKISVVTPNYNQGKYLEQTILSVIQQEYPNLEYIIIDGGSTDESISVIKKYEKHLAYWVSEKDKGMYFAIEKGFKKSTGAIMCWINSDDVLWHNSLHTVAEIFSKNPQINWLQGFPSVIDEQGKLLYQRPPVASASYFYSKSFLKSHEFIQQESTYWTRSLYNKSQGINTQFALAADFDLWMQFFKHETLYCTKKQLGAFRKREGQKSENIEAYVNEALISLEINKPEATLKNKVLVKLKGILGTPGKKTHWIENL